MRTPGAGERTGTIVRHTDLGRGYFELEIKAPGIARNAKAGQFIGVIPPDSRGTILRRPFSVADAHGGRLLLLCREVGEGTRALSRAREGEVLDILGPLGRGFRLPPARVDLAVLAGGGYGMAPLLFLARALRRSGLARRIMFIGGARTVADLVWRRRIAGIRWLATRWATDDGSFGARGTVADLYSEAILEARGKPASFACGPIAMLAALWRRSQDLRLQVAMEARMACGMGTCQGCAIPMAGGTGHAKYVRACTEGPVFPANEIAWDEYE